MILPLRLEHVDDAQIAGRTLRDHVVRSLVTRIRDDTDTLGVGGVDHREPEHHPILRRLRE
jgi:hypothetical protein